MSKGWKIIAHAIIWAFVILAVSLLIDDHDLAMKVVTLIGVASFVTMVLHIFKEKPKDAPVAVEEASVEEEKEE